MTSKFQMGMAAGMLSAVAFAQGPPTVIYKQRASFADAGVKQTFEYMASELSFDGNVVKNAPYSAEAVTETTQQLADGNRIARKTSATLYRDSEGRSRREETLSAIGPWANGNQPSQTVFINDPVSGTNLVLETRTKTARKMPSPRVMTSPPPPPGIAGAAARVQVPDQLTMIGVEGGLVQAEIAKKVAVMKSGGGDVMFTSTAGTPAGGDPKKESLGTQMIEGVQAEGTRTTVTIPAGAIGNDLPIQIVSERWYSPELQTVVISKHNDPRMGETVYHLTNIGRSEPARSLFEVPADYTISDFSKPVVVK